MVDRCLLACVAPAQRRCDDVVDVRHRLAHALAAVALAAVAQLRSLVLAGRCAGGYRGAAERAAAQQAVDFHRRVAARVEHFPRDELLYLHRHLLYVASPQRVL
jgi:hypothetical protein